MSQISPSCVAGYHLNPNTCGVAKFNQIIAEHFGVEHISIFDSSISKRQNAFISIKVSEMSESDFEKFESWVFQLPKDFFFYLFLHDFSDTTSEIQLVQLSQRTFCGNSELLAKLMPFSPRNIALLWSPGTLKLSPQIDTGPTLRLFTFGMAHKLRASYYHKIRDLFASTGIDYVLYISTAVHEGTSLENMLESSFSDLKVTFGDRVRYLGYLSDYALHQYLKQADFLVAFFQKGVRANNSSVNTALEIGLPVITNLDSHSPDYFVHGENVLDIEQLKQVPLDLMVRHQISANAKATAASLSWESFFKELQRNA